MVGKSIRVAALFTIAALCGATATTLADDKPKTKIVGFTTDEIDVYSDATAATKLGQIHSADAKLPIDVIEVAPNYMILVDIGELHGWIYATMVETQGSLFGSIDVGPCNHALPEQYAAVRNVGNNCSE
jgi:hypothetical protein